MNSQAKFTTPSSKFKVHIANSLTISSYPVRFATEIVFSLVSFAFSLVIFVFFFEIKNIYSDAHLTSWAGKWKNFFHPADFRRKTTFFGLIIMVMKIPEKMVIIFATAKNYSLTKPLITLLMSISTVSRTSEMIFVILKKAAALIENETRQ